MNANFMPFTRISLLLLFWMLVAVHAQAADYDPQKKAVSRGFGSELSSQLAQSPLTMQASYRQGEIAYFFKDYANARRYWQPLAKQGLADAQARLGWMAQMGLGQAVDLAGAIALYEAAAVQGQAVAQNNLAVLYQSGLGLKKDLDKARTFFEASARQGYRFAQYNLAELFSRPQTAFYQPEQAKYWARLAAAQGLAEAEQLLEALP